MKIESGSLCEIGRQQEMVQVLAEAMEGGAIRRFEGDATHRPD
ncbi:MAG: hypothetical protein ACREWG_07585 [Gammaproteobacteria bacterium]